MTQKTNYKVGQIITISTTNKWTLGRSLLGEDPWLRECPTPLSEHYHDSFEKHHDSFEGKVALIVNIIKNRLDQPMGYRVQIGEKIWLCKSVIAEKYFELVGDQDNVANRTTSKVQIF